MKKNFLKLATITLLVFLCISVGIFGYLNTQNILNDRTLSDGLFFAIIFFIMLSFLPYYDVITSNNFISSFYIDIIKGKKDDKGRFKNTIPVTDHSFSIVTFSVAVLLIITLIYIST